MNGKRILVASFWPRPQEKLTNRGRLRLPKELKQLKKNNSGNHRKRSGLILTALSVGSKICSTCAFWGGSREISRRGCLQIHPYSKGGCRRVGFGHLPMGALATCGGWRLWPALNEERRSRQRCGQGNLSYLGSKI